MALCAAGCWLANLLALLSKHGVAPELWRFDAVTAAGLRARAADEQGRRVASAHTPTHLGSWAGRRRRQRIRYRSAPHAAFTLWARIYC